MSSSGKHWCNFIIGNDNGSMELIGQPPIFRTGLINCVLEMPYHCHGKRQEITPVNNILLLQRLDY